MTKLTLKSREELDKLVLEHLFKSTLEEIKVFERSIDSYVSVIERAIVEENYPEEICLDTDSYYFEDWDVFRTHPTIKGFTQQIAKVGYRLTFYRYEDNSKELRLRRKAGFDKPIFTWD